MTVEPMLDAERGTEGSASSWRSGFRGAPVLPKTPVGCLANKAPLLSQLPCCHTGEPTVVG